tara:strand:- start:1312 stop:1536 length:225 start_codon:yes stop_codon:yes gene_type:complete
MSQLIMTALLKEAEAKESKAIANLQNYMSNSAGIGEHPDVVAECSKLVKDIAEARELKETVTNLVSESNNNQNQ